MKPEYGERVGAVKGLMYNDVKPTHFSLHRRYRYGRREDYIDYFTAKYQRSRRIGGTGGPTSHSGRRMMWSATPTWLPASVGQKREET